ncbi:MAG: hypothetical protein ABH828_03415 [archaeon]
MISKKLVERRIIMFFIVLSLVIPLTFSIMSLDKEIYSLGEVVTITLNETDNYSLTINSETNAYKYLGGLSEVMEFQPEEIGDYSVDLIKDEQIIEQKYFTVTEGQPPTPSHDGTLIIIEKDKFYVNDIVKITIPVEFLELSIIQGENVYRFLGKTREGISFVPHEIGNYTIEVVLPDGYFESRIFEAFAKDANITEEPVYIEEIPFALKDSSGQILDTTLKIVNQTGDEVEAVIDFAPSEEMAVKKIRFKNLNMSKNSSELRIENIHPQKFTKGNYINAFAIDPTLLDFEEAEVTMSTIGTELWKCKDYNFETQTCFGEFIKIANLIPGQDYIFTLTPEDPVFTQTGYLTNPSFTSDITTGWTQLTETTPAVLFNYVGSDPPQSGVAEIANTARSKNSIGSYYQTFTLTIPTGTTLDNINFSALWRINSYDQPGNVYLWVQNTARTATYCSWTQSFSSTTGWATAQVNTREPACSLASFSPGTDYTFRLRCNLVTGSSIKDERCRWDEASVIVYYNDTQSPIINSWNEIPDPVSIGASINITADVTDNIEVDSVWAEIDGTNYSYTQSPGTDTWYYEDFDTNIAPGIYNYDIFANDTSSNLATSQTGSFTIADETPPSIKLENPPIDTYTNNAPELFYYNVSDASTISSCWVVMDGVNVQEDASVTRDISQNIPYTMSYGYHNWQINCTDSSANANSNLSLTRNITFDNAAPSITLNEPGNTNWVNSNTIVFNYTPTDDYFGNCSLWGNFSGPWAFDQINLTPNTGIKNWFEPVVLSDGSYKWNVKCYDQAGNSNWNAVNYTFTVDTVPPYWSNPKVEPASGVTYSPGANYQANITWEDIIDGIDTVWIEHNVTGAMEPYPPTGNNGAEYYFNLNDLPAGEYSYQWFANDSVGNVNQSPIYYYTIEKITSIVNLTINDTDDDFFVGLNDFANLTGFLINPPNGYIELYVEGVLVNSGSNYLNNISQFTEEKAYNITVTYPATQNYSYASETHYVIVSDTTSPVVGLTSPEEGSWEKGIIIFYYYPDDNIEITNCTLILDGQLNETKNATDEETNNFTISGIGEGVHSWDVNCSDPSYNTGINGTPLNFNVDNTLPTAFNLISPDGTYFNYVTPTLTWQQTSEDNFLNYSIEIDNDIGFSSINYAYEITDMATTSKVVGPININRTRYWRVQAYDLAKNMRVSSQVFNFTIDTEYPQIILNSPSDDDWINYFDVDFLFNVTDITNLLNCSVIINGTLNESNFGILNNQENTISIIFNEDGSYNWSVECYDYAHNRNISEPRYLYVHTQPPEPFDLSTPLNYSLSNNRNPLLNWTQSDEPLLSNYTVLVSTAPDFSAIVYTYYTYDVTHTNYSVVDNWVDDTYYWHVIAYDYAGNERNSTQDFIYRVDGTAPTDFTLSTPENGTESTDLTPLLNWTQTADSYFTNYTVYVSDDSGFSYYNYTYNIYNIATTEYQVTVDWITNTVWYWYVTAYDNATNAKNSTDTFVYVTDTDTPIVNLENPVPDNIWTTSQLITFEYNVSDSGTIDNCSLIINGSNYQDAFVIEKDTTQNFLQSLDNGAYNWSVQCTDKAGTTGYSIGRLLTVNVTIPTTVLWETSESGGFSPPAQINLSYIYDYVEDSVSDSFAVGLTSNLANATYTVGGSGFIMPAGTFVNFSGVFMTNLRSKGYVSWWFSMSDSSGNYPICNYGNNDATGAQIVDKDSKVTVIGSCNSQLSDVRLQPGDKFSLLVVGYNAGPQTITFNHYWDNVDASWVSFLGYRLGVLNATFVNFTDPAPGEGENFNETCNVTCSDGECINTRVYLQYNSSEGWKDIWRDGNIRRDPAQENPVMIGNINSSVGVNFTLLAYNYSFDNQIRCFAESSDDNFTSAVKNITITDNIPPNVTLISPSPGAAFDPQNITFIYKPLDVRLTNCTLWGNFSGVWNYTNQTDLLPINDQNNNFTLYLSYGKYEWNVQCLDEVNNSGFATSNWTIIVAGDVAINSSGITFSNYDAVEGENITIFANVSNNANKNETGVIVQFWRGDPDSGGVELGNKTLSLTALGTNVTNYTWITTLGQYDFYVVVDPPYGSGNLIEIDETNNKAFNSISIDSWQTFYGLINGSLKLGNSAEDNFSSWFSTSTTGNIYITDTDTSAGISWTFLLALTRNTTGLAGDTSLDDFSEIDTNLGTGSYVDSVNNTYSENNNPKKTDSFTAYQKTITNVPVVNSTNTSDFVTGILWDSDDSSNGYYDSTDDEDIVFVTKINEGKAGAYGIYDYEIRIPSNLKSYKGGTETVSLYYELV